MNKLIVVTGGTKGIGRAIIEIFAANQFDVVTCARGKDDLTNLKSEISGKYKVEVHTFPADLSQRTGTAGFVGFVQSLQRPVDILVNNTGMFAPGQVHDEEEGTLEKMINTNLYSAYHTTRGLIGEMKKLRKGHIFTICSTASIVPYTNGGSYCISKFALLGMTKVLREEMKPHDVRVTSILPGATFTASWEGAEIPQSRFMKPEDVANAIYTAYSVSGNTVIEEILLRPQLGDL